MRKTLILLIVFALMGSSAAALQCEWRCASATTAPTAPGHCHGDGSGGPRIGAAGHACDHAVTSVVALRLSVEAKETAGIPSAIAPDMVRAGRSAAHYPTTDVGPPGSSRPFSFGSHIPLRI